MEETGRTIVDPQTGQTVTDRFGNSQWSRQYVYNSQGFMTDAYDARQIHSIYTPDGLNRVTQIQYSDGTPAVTFSYGEALAGYYNTDKLTSVSTPGVGSTPLTKQAYNYDQMGRVTKQTESIGLGGGVSSGDINYTYNLAGELTSQSYPGDGRVVYFAYDEGGRLSQVSDGWGRVYDSGFSYAPHGGLTSETFGNNAVRSASYNNAFQPSQLKLTLGGVEQQRYDYSYGVVTQSTGAVDTTKNNGQLGRVDGYIGGSKQWDQRYSYDALSRLSDASEYQSGASLTYQLHYDYDRWGNRMQYQGNVNVPGGYTPVTSSDYDSVKNQFIQTGPTAVGYDAAGNITQDLKFRGMSYTYDANSRTTGAVGTSAGSIPSSSVYDGVGQRLHATVNNATKILLYDVFGRLVADYSDAPLLENTYIYRGSGQLLAIDNASIGASGAQNVPWGNAVGVSVTRNKLTKTAGTAWGNAGASSAQSFSGDGYMEFTASETNTARMVGLNHGDPDLNYPINFAIYPYQDGNAYVFENGNYILNLGAYATGDKFKIAVESGVVKYYRNGNLVYTSGNTPVYPLNVDTSFYDYGSTITDVKITAPAACTGLKYVMQDLQGSTRVVMQGANIVSRHDYLPYGEDILSGVGLRNPGQLYGAADTTRPLYAMMERDQATGLDHTWWRKNDSRAGKWTSPDPISGGNAYAYGGNDPINKIDPTGLLEIGPYVGPGTPVPDGWRLIDRDQWNGLRDLSKFAKPENPEKAKLTNAQRSGYKAIKTRASVMLQSQRCRDFLTGAGIP